MSQCSRYHKHVEDLVAMPGDVECSGFPLLGYPGNIKPRSRGVQYTHQELIPQSNENVGVSPINNNGVSCGNHSREAHGEKEGGPEETVLRRREAGREKSDYDERAEDAYGAEVEEARIGVAIEGVVDRGKEGAHNHDGDPGIIEPPEEEVELSGMGGQEVGEGATD